MRGAVVHADIVCPVCSEKIQDYIVVIWGCTPSTGEYEIGDAIGWIKSSTGKVLDPYHTKPDGRLNFGDPNLKRVIILDEQNLSPEFYPICPHCKAELDGAGVYVEDNVIVSVKVFLKGDLDPVKKSGGIPPSIIEVGENSQMIGRYDLSDHVHYPPS